MMQKRILVVEDESIIAMNIAVMLKSRGYSIIGIAATGEDAISSAFKERPDLILMDIKLTGDMDGIEAAVSIKARMGVPVIFMTAHSDPATVERSKAAGPHGYIVKPVGENELSSVIQIALHRFELERRLTESEERYRSIINSTPLGIHFYELRDNGLVFTGANSSADRILGVDNARFIGKTIGEAFPPLLDTEVPRRYRDAADAGAAWHTEQIEYRHGAIAGAYEVYAFRTSAGKMAAMFMDISERKKFEEDLRIKNRKLDEANEALTAANEELESMNGELEANYREMELTQKALAESSRLWDVTFDSINDAISIIDTDSTIITCNRAMNALAGKSKSEIVGRHCYELVHGTDKPIPDCPVWRMAISRKRESMDMYHNGRWYTVAVDPICDDSGAITSAIHIVKDITDRKTAELALRDSEIRYRLIADNITDTIWLMGMDFKVTYISPSVTRVRGFTLEELRSIPLDRQMTGSSHQKVIRRIGEELTPERLDDPGGEISITEELEFYRKDGSIFWGEITVILLRDSGGRPMGFLGVGRDITERKRADDILRLSLKEKELLLKEIHHRVKNNMQVIISLLDLQANRLLNERDRDLVLNVENSIRTMALAHEKLYKAGTFTSISMADYVRDLTPYIVMQFPQAAGRVSVTTDIQDLQLDIDEAIPCGLIITELMMNSMRHAFPGGQEGSLAVRFNNGGGKRVLTVRDSGIGLPAGFDLAKTGSLGLMLVQALTRQLNGDLLMECSGGTSFSITF